MAKENYLIDLIEIIRVLKKNENEIAKKHLKAYGTNHTRRFLKMFQLYKAIKINEVQDFCKLKKKVSPNSTDESFNRLIKRTIERVQESLILDVNIKRTGAYSQVFTKKFFLRKNLIEAQILMGRGLKNLPLRILNRVIVNSKKYELYDELIEALYFKQIILSNTFGISSYNNLEKEITFYENCRMLLRKSKSLRESYNAGIFAKAGSKVSVQRAFDFKIDQLLENFEETNSSNILSNYFLLKIESERLKGNSVVTLIRDFIELISKSPAIYSSVRLAYLYNELAISLISEVKFEESIVNVKKSITLVSDKSLTFLICKVISTKSNILLCRFEQAVQISTKIIEKKRFEKHVAQLSILLYYKSISLFGMSDYNSALRILSKKNEIEKDKEGWNVWIRIMRILCSIELLQLNLIEYDVESFRKYIQRIDKQFEVRKRDKLILKILLELDKCFYDFEEVAQTRKEELALLASADKTMTWNPDSPEMILFHDWFEAKRTKTEYKPNFEVYRKLESL